MDWERRSEVILMAFMRPPGTAEQQLLVFPGGRGCDDDPDDRVQRGAGDVQEPQVPSVGPRRPDLHPALLALLLLQHRRRHLRRRLRGQGQGRHLQAGNHAMFLNQTSLKDV